MSDELAKPAPQKKGRTPGSGRKPILDGELVAAAIVTFNGNLKAIAKHFGVHRSSVQEKIGKSKALTKILNDVREGELDDAESVLYSRILAGEAWAVCFKLKTQGKSRGYVERAELDMTTRDKTRDDAERDALLAQRYAVLDNPGEPGPAADHAEPLHSPGADRPAAEVPPPGVP